MIGAAMRIVKVGVLAPTNKGIPLGVQGENSATQVEFDTRPWFREYPSGTVSAVARRDGDPAPYPLTLDVADGTAVWQVSDIDTAKAGEGAVELTMTSAGARVRSLTFKTLVTASLTDSPVDDDAWYGWLDKAVVKVDDTVQSAQRKMGEVDLEWNALKADVTEKVDECAEVAAQAASDAHHAKVDAQVTAKALESAEGSVAKAEAAANRAVDAALASDDSAVEASRSALSAGESAESAAGSATNAATSASEASTSASNAADAASAASGSASAAEQSATDANNAKAAAQTAKADAATSASNAATSASNAATSAENAANSARAATNSVNSINVIAPKNVNVSAVSSDQFDIAIGQNAHTTANQSIAIGVSSVASHLSSIAIGGFATTSKDYELAIGVLLENGAETTREITHVSTPTAPTSAATKKYTDDNDAKTLNEAKKYTDANTSNALVGKVSGKLLHVEDAWPGKPLGLTIEGAYKQDGTPSPENPVPITVVENPVLKVTGRNLFDCDKGLNRCFTKNADGTYTITKISDDERFSAVIPLQILNGVKVYISVTHMSAGVTDSVSIIFDYSDGTQETSPLLSRDITAYFVKKDVRFLRFYVEGKVAIGESFTFLPQIEYGTKATAYAPYSGTSLPITLPAEHPYLAALPDGTHDEIVIDKDGNASLVARIKRVLLDKSAGWFFNETGGGNGAYNEATDGADKTVALTQLGFREYGFSAWNAFIFGGRPFIVDSDANDVDGVIEKFGTGSYMYYKLATPITYQLGKLDIPSLPETISNVWTDAELTTNMSMTYKRDINVAFDNLAQAVVAAAAGE